MVLHWQTYLLLADLWSFWKHDRYARWTRNSSGWNPE